MTIYDELVARQLIAQTTDEKEIRELVNNGRAVFYIGFDPTADSLHAFSSFYRELLCMIALIVRAVNKFVFVRSTI